MKEKKMTLVDGSQIAVIGGGPSGSFFSYFALNYAKQIGIQISIDIIEAKNFNCDGASGCNQCGGVVSESLVKMLSKDGIVLPSKVIRKGIETYTLHLEQGRTKIEAPIDDQKIATMFRGIGPRGCKQFGQQSFDDYLLELCTQKGAVVIFDKVTSLNRTKNGIAISTENNFNREYDLVVGAVGLNKKSLNLFKPLCTSFEPPKTTRAFISEISLEKKIIDKYFGNSMHVFLINIPNIKFGALIPKANYVTLVLLGTNINREIADRFMQSEPVKKCFPKNFNINKVIPCQCLPMISIKGAKSAFSNRVVIIGDSSTSKLYKNGIGAAYITAKAAASTALFHGISHKHFHKYYKPTCDKLKRDNKIGTIIFKITSVVQKSSSLKKAMHYMILNEQNKNKANRNMSSILWDTFTGSAPYGDIFSRFMHPRVLIPMLRSTFRGLFG